MMLKIAFATLTLLAGVSVAPAVAAPPTRDYFKDKFETEQLLDWGSRPVFSPDSKKIAFTVDDEHFGPAYEIDVATKKVRCLTCQWGVNGYVARVYYLNDGSFLLTAPVDLERREQKLNAQPVRARGTNLYWMPADLSTPPQLLGPQAVGEIALDYDFSKAGETRISWGEMEPRYRMMMGSVINDGKRAWLVNRTILHDVAKDDPNSKLTFIETYDFVDDGKSVLFFTIEKGRLYNGMYKLDIATSKLTSLESDPQHNETHVFPDTRYGLEESNRASDPNGPYRGVSGHRDLLLAIMLKQSGEKNAEALGKKYGGKTFDLYMYDWKTGQRRQLTNASAAGGESHQSTPARDGRHIAYAVRSGIEGKYTGQKGLFLGTFNSGK